MPVSYKLSPTLLLFFLRPRDAKDEGLMYSILKVKKNFRRMTIFKQVRSGELLCALSFRPELKQ